MKFFHNKIPGVSRLVTTAVLNAKVREIENKILLVSGLVKKIYYNPKISDIDNKHFTNSD